MDKLAVLGLQFEIIIELIHINPEILLLEAMERMIEYLIVFAFLVNLGLKDFGSLFFVLLWVKDAGHSIKDIEETFQVEISGRLAISDVKTVDLLPAGHIGRQKVELPKEMD